MACTIEDIERLLSPLGVMLFSDHDGDGETDDDVVNDAIGRAWAEIIGHLYPLYPVEELEQSALVNDWCVVMAAYYLCTRRGNPVPDSIAHDFGQITGPEGWIFVTKKCAFRIPGIKSTEVNAPALTNHVIDRRYTENQSRVVKPVSTAIDSELPRPWSRRRWY